MAEQLGTAELVITVNDKDALRKLGELKKQVIDLEDQAGRQTTKTRTATAKASPAEVERKRAERAAEQAANKRVSIQNRLNILEAKGVDVTAFRLRAARANEAAQQSQFDSARQINAQLGRALSIEENRLRVSTAQTAQLKRQEAAAKGTASTVTKAAQKPTGVGFATTPEQILASRGGTQRGAASSINAAETFLNKTTQLSNRINVLAAKGVDISKLRASFEQVNATALQSQFGTSQRLIQNLTREVSIQENNLRITKLREAAEKRRATEAAKAAKAAAAAQAAQVSPAGDKRIIPNFIPFSATNKAEQALAKTRLNVAEATTKATTAEQRQIKQRQQRGGRGGVDAGGIISSALIGGAFPLLFGQGGGAAGGGLIGGLVGGAFGGGGGFAGSLVGTLIGQTADKFGELAKALQDPITNFDALIQGANLSGKGVEELAKVLIDLGRTSEANALIQADLARTIDSVGVLKVAAANDAFARTIGDIQERIGFLIAGPATQFISWIDQIIKRVVDLPGGRPTEESALAARRRGTVLGIGGTLLGAVGLAAAPFTGGASLGLALGGAGLIGAGATLTGSSEFQQQQIADSAAIERLQGNILTIEERRIRVQRGISDAVSAGRKNTEAELRLEDRLLQLDAQRLQVLANIQAGPLDESGASVRAGRAAVAAIDLQKRAAISAEDQRKRALRATASLEATQNQLALQSVSERIAAARQLGSVEQGVVRATLEQALNIKNGIAEARRREQDIGAQITAARQVGDESGAARLVDQQKVAAQETKLRIIEGATALRDTASELRKSGEKLRNDLDSAFLNLQKLRTGEGGLNQFLSPQDRVNQEQRTFETLLPRFRQAQEQFKRLRGVETAPEFTGSRSGVNASILQFIEAVRTEQQAVDTSVDTQKALSDNTAALAKITGELQSTIAALNGKNWAVNVQVNADGSSQAYGDILAGAVSP